MRACACELPDKAEQTICYTHEQFILRPQHSAKTQKLYRNRLIFTKSIALLYGNAVFANRPSWRSFHKEWSVRFSGTNKLDEFPEFDRRVIEALRQPMEDRIITIARSKGSAIFPARFTLIAAMNPCPCGNFGHPTLSCVCMPHALERYRRKISGPIADRIDLWAQMGPVELSELGKRSKTNEETLRARSLVTKARNRQRERYGDHKTNSDLSPREIDELIPEQSGARKTLTKAGVRFNLSPRGYHRTLKVARTIADLDEADDISENHVLEALQYRQRKE